MQLSRGAPGKYPVLEPCTSAVTSSAARAASAQDWCLKCEFHIHKRKAVLENDPWSSGEGRGNKCRILSSIRTLPPLGILSIGRLCSQLSAECMFCVARGWHPGAFQFQVNLVSRVISFWSSEAPHHRHPRPHCSAALTLCPRPVPYHSPSPDQLLISKDSSPCSLERGLWGPPCSLPVPWACCTSASQGPLPRGLSFLLDSPSCRVPDSPSCPHTHSRACRYRGGWAVEGRRVLRIWVWCFLRQSFIFLF